ncbi:MAG: DUF4402 domain-containing protein, partial [Alphaproteobacteria bacterium]|nr:DUF4402 domain-containing protein [Alphaproteobacteria bacterium]
ATFKKKGKTSLLKYILPFSLFPITCFSQSIQEITPLTFCNTVADANGGVIQINEKGGCLSLSGNHTFSSSPTRGQYEIKGTPFKVVEVMLSGTSLSGPGDSLSLDNLVSSPSFDIDLDSEGKGTFYVSGDLTINPRQTFGNYSGYYTINYRYNEAIGTGSWLIFSNALSQIELLPLPIIIQQNQNIDFSDVAPDPAGGVIKINIDGSLENVSGDSIFFSNGTPGNFSVSGSPNTEISINLIPGTLTGNGEDLSLHTLEHNASATPQLDSNGNLNFNTGAQLNIKANQAPGIYQGNYTVEIIY